MDSVCKNKVENSKLLAIIDKYYQDSSPDNLEKLGKELSRATFLLGIQTNVANFSTPINSSLKAADTLQIFGHHMNTKRPALLAFTSFDEIKKYQPQNASGFLMSAKELWNFASSQKRIYKGVLIDPCGAEWYLPQNHIENLLNEFGLKDCL